MPKMTNYKAMTNDEAIELIQDDIRLHHDYLSSKYKKALRMATKSLQADTVSRSQYQGLLNAIGKVYVEVVRCKDCIHRQTDKCPMYHEEWYTIDEDDGYWDDVWNVYDYTVDDGFCYLGDTKGGVGE